MFLYKHFIGGSETSEVDDVIRNLGFILRSKRSLGYFLPSFGLSDIGFRTPEAMITTVTDEIKENIRLYEPRVELLDVKEVYDDDGGGVRLVVSMRLRSADEKLRLVVDIANKSFDITPVEEKRKK